ncbi:glutaredoxin family protein [Cellulomonas rhizosphaerae]|uniref:Glutaredoxin family protein n=1 Tax=Cellulomonas rhizosphaerae TaxID=2293719 RepID=A0A413RQX7_9CELL|nr:glutaredoxin family protein [Cellulomonas rhizosphaerae]RHA44343.1 glutaredoxin family protein [Cellulomonas rhizosphaerae]
MTSSGPTTDGPTTSETAGEARIVLFGRDGCHLCDDARELVRALADEAGAQWREVEIDAAGGSVLEEYGELVPVVEVDGVRQGYWRIDADRVRRALATARR